MKKLFLVLIIIAAGSLVGCKSGGGSGGVVPQGVHATCADVKNDGDVSDCGAAPVAFNSTVTGALIEINAGVVSRGTLIEATMEATNPTASDFAGFYRMEFDAGCNGAPTWEILPKQAFNIPAGQTMSNTVGGSCGDMPLGDRTLTAELYDEDSITILDTVIVSFTLVE